IGRSIASVLYWFMRIEDRLEEKLAVRRDVSRQRKAAMAARAEEEARRKMAAEASRLAAEEAERRAAAEQERLGTLAAGPRAADQADYLDYREDESRSADAAAQKAQLLATEEARRQEEAGRLARAEQSPDDERAPAPEHGQERHPVAQDAAEEGARVAAEEAI